MYFCQLQFYQSLFLLFFCFSLARLREPQDGLFTGQIDAVDTVNYSYRVTFDRPGLACSNIACCLLLFETFLLTLQDTKTTKFTK